MSATPFRNKCLILADLWINYRDDENFAEYIKYSDLGLPLAYIFANNIITGKRGKEAVEDTFPIATPFIDEAFRVLLDGLDIEDLGFELIDDVFEAAGFGPDSVDVDDDDDLDFDLEDEDDEDEAETPWQTGWNVGWELGWESGVNSERTRTQDIVAMQKRWAKENNKAKDYMFWNNVGEILKPVDIDSDDVSEDDF